MYLFEILLLFGMAEVLYRVIYSNESAERGRSILHHQMLNDLRNGCIISRVQ